MRQYLHFYYAGKYSNDMGVIAVSDVMVDSTSSSSGNGLYEEPFLASTTINETKVRDRSPYFHGVTRSPLSFKLNIAFEQPYTEDLKREVARWLRQDTYQEFYFLDDPLQRRYFCMPEGDIKFYHNGANEGYIELTMRCDTEHAYSPEYVTRIFDFSKNPFIYEEDPVPNLTPEEVSLHPLYFYQDDNEGSSNGTLTNLVIQDGSIKLQKEGKDVIDIKDNATAWNKGTHNHTTAVNGVLEIDYQIPPGTDFDKTYNDNTSWNQYSSISNVVVSNNSIQLAREGTDKTHTPDWTGTFSNTRVNNGSLELDYQYQPGTDLNIVKSTKPDWEDQGATFTNVDTTTQYDNIILSKEGDNLVYSEESYDDLNTGTLTSVQVDQTNGYVYLQKEGTDYNGYLDTDFTTGTPTFTNTVAASDGVNNSGILKLAKQGTDLVYFKDTQSDFNGIYRTLSGVTVGTDGKIRLSLPSYSFTDLMTNWHNNWSSVNADAYMKQYSNFVRIETGNSGSEQGMYTTAPNIPTNFLCTIDFMAQVTGKVNILISDGTNAHKILIPNSPSGQISRYRIQLNGIYSNNVVVYRDGVQLSVSVQSQLSGYPKQIRFSMDKATAGRIDLYRVYYASSQLGAPPSNNIITGYFESNYISGTSSVVAVASTLLEYAANFNSNAFGYQNYYVQVRKSDSNNNVLQDWTTINNSSAISIISKGENIANEKFDFRIYLQTDDWNFSPEFDWIRLTFTSAYYTSGTYQFDRYSSNSAIANTVKASYGKINYYMRNQPTGTNIQVQTQVSYDNGSTWSTLKTVSNGGNIPDIVAGQSSANMRLRVIVTLSTTDVAVSPELDRLEYPVYSAYKATGSKETNPIDISAVKKAGSAIVEWSNIGDPSTSISVQVALSTDGGSTWGAYQTVSTSGGQIPQITQSTDLSNARIKVKFNLTPSSSLSLSPQLDWLKVTLVSGYKTSGDYISGEIPLQNINKVKTSTISWNQNLPTNTSITVYTRLGDYDSGTQTTTWGSWTTATNGSAIPSLGAGTVVPSNKRLQIRASLSTTDTTVTPEFWDITLFIDATEGERYTSGTYVSPDIDLTTVGKAGSTLVNFTSNIPTNTTALFEVDFYDGTSWVGYQAVINGGALPNITQSTDLNGKKIRYRITLTTSNADKTVTSSVSGITINLTSGYKPSGSWISNPLNISNVNKVVSSLLEMTQTLDVNTSVSVQARTGTYNAGTYTWNSWNTILNSVTTSASPITGLEKDVVTNGNLYLQLQVNLSNTNTLRTPKVNSLHVFIDATIGERYTSATYESEPIDISQAVKAGVAKLDWTFVTPPELSNKSHIKAYACLSRDGGTTWSDYQPIDDDMQIGEIDQDLDLTNTFVKYKFVFMIEKVTNLTPSVSRTELDILSGYKKQGVRISPPISLDKIDLAYNSLIEWTANTPEGTQVTIEISDDNGTTWYPATNGSTIPKIIDGTDVSNTTLIIRETLTTFDSSKSPSISHLKCTINMGIVFENFGDLDVRPELWIEKIGDGDITIINRDNGQVFQFTGLKDGETVYVDNENEDIVSSLDGVYRYDNFNDSYLIVPRGKNDLEIQGTCRLQFRYRLKILSG